MDRKGQHSVQGTSQQQTSPYPDRDTNISKLPIPLQPLPPIDTNDLKNIPFAPPQFTIPPLPIKPRRRTASPDNSISPNPARHLFSYPVSYPHDAPPEYKMPQDDGPPPARRRRLNSPESRGRAPTTEDDSESRRSSGSKGLSYDPVHEYHQQAHQHHRARRPSSAHSQHSHVSSYSAQSSNAEEDESGSPIVGDQSTTRDGKKRKHRCSECGQYFTRLHNLKSHLLTHSQEKPFICKECNHKFRRLHDLKRHHKLHTGERPYTCPGCNRSFARMDALNRHRKPGGECSLHNLQPTTPTGSQQNAIERRMSLPPGFGRPGSSQGSTSPMPQSSYISEVNINPALAMSAHGQSYPPTHLPPKQKHRYQHDSGDTSPGLLAPPPSNTAYGRNQPQPSFPPSRPSRQPPPLVIPSPAMGPSPSPHLTHHYSGTGSSSSGGRSGLEPRSPVPPMTRDDGNVLPSYPLTESPRGYTPPPQPPPPLTVPPPSLPLLPSPGTLISPSRNSYDRSTRVSIDMSRPSEGSRGYFENLIDRNERLEERVKQLEHYVGVLWQERDNVHHRRQSIEDHPRLSS